MAEKTSIAWTRSTFNAWIGCTEVGPGCDNCYARELDKRHKWGGALHWGPGIPRFRTSEKNWSHPIEWNKLAALEQRTGILTLRSDWKGKIGFWPVFCASLADVFDNEVSPQWRGDLWRLIRATPNLSWLLVTKRIGNVEKMWPGGDYPNVRLLITVCNQEEADRDIPKLLALPCKNGVSYEPALGPVDWRGFLWSSDKKYVRSGTPKVLEWIIVGGESTQGAGKARPFDLAWARSTIAQCKTAGVPVFCKQLGSNAVVRGTEGIQDVHLYPAGLRHRAGADPAEWPSDLKVQEFPE